MTTLTAADRVVADELASELVTAYSRLPPTDRCRAAAREKAISAWLPMAGRLARRYLSRGESFDDLRQVATVGLIKAVDRFDPERGADFVAFAVPTVLGELRRHFRDRGWAIRVPRRLQTMTMAIGAAGSDLSQVYGRWPTIPELAAHLGVTEEEILEGLEGSRAYRALPLSTPLGGDGSMTLGDTLGQDDRGLALAELRLALGPAMRCLSNRERLIVTSRYFGNQTQTQIAERIGVSQMQISRLLAGALAKLRRQLMPAGL